MGSSFRQQWEVVERRRRWSDSKSDEGGETIVVVAVQKRERERRRRRRGHKARERCSSLLTPLRTVVRSSDAHFARSTAMARSVYSPSPSPSLRSITDFSDSSDDDAGSYGEAAEYGGSASRPASPVTADTSMTVEEQEADTMTCQWEDCGRVFNHLPTLIDHIHNGTQLSRSCPLSQKV